MRLVLIAVLCLAAAAPGPPPRPSGKEVSPPRTKAVIVAVLRLAAADLDYGTHRIIVDALTEIKALNNRRFPLGGRRDEVEPYFAYLQSRLYEHYRSQKSVAQFAEALRREATLLEQAVGNQK